MKKPQDGELIFITPRERQMLADLSEAIDTSLLSDDPFYRRASWVCSKVSSREEQAQVKE